jgi:hypothetical protein
MSWDDANRPRTLLSPCALALAGALALGGCAGGIGSSEEPAAEAAAAGAGSGDIAAGSGDAAATDGPTTDAGMVVEIASPAGPGSAEPNLFAAADGRVYMSWLEAAGPEGVAPASTRRGRFALRFASLDGDSWSAPRNIAEGDDFFVNWADFPAIVESGGTLAAHWLRRNGGPGTSYDINIVRSGDGGATWSAPVVPHADGTRTEHGFVSLVPEPEGGFTAIWLDGRELAGEDEGASREMTLRAARFDGDGNQGPEALLDPRICDCCQTSAAHVGDALVAVYRDRSPTEIRDIWSVRRTPDGWQEPVRVSHDDWQIPGCPVNGPAIASHDDAGAIAWFSLRNGDPEVKLSFTRDAGASFSPPILIDSGSAAAIDAGDPRDVAGLAGASSTAAPIPLGLVDVAWVDETRVVVTWVVARGSEADIVLQTVGGDGNLGRRHVVATTGSGRASGFPQIVRSADRLVLAWTDTGEASLVRTAVIPLPVP